LPARRQDGNFFAISIYYLPYLHLLLKKTPSRLPGQNILNSFVVFRKGKALLFTSKKRLTALPAKVLNAFVQQ